MFVVVSQVLWPFSLPFYHWFYSDILKLYFLFFYITSILVLCFASISIFFKIYSEHNDINWEHVNCRLVLTK